MLEHFLLVRGLDKSGCGVKKKQGAGRVRMSMAVLNSEDVFLDAGARLLALAFQNVLLSVLLSSLQFVVSYVQEDDS
jgi:hypothetical protein